MSQIGTISSQTKNHVATITFGHPKSNSLPGDLLRKLADAIEKAGNDRETRVVLLKSEGEKAFCAGASFDELAAIRTLDEGKHFFMGFALVINAIRRCPKIVIVRVQGKAVGGGVGLAASGDYTLATDGASLKLSELALGIGPFVVGPAVERKVGPSAFAAMSIDTDWRSAKWGLENGLYTRIFTSIEELDHSVNDLAERLIRFSPDALAELKKILWEGTADWDTLLEQRAEISGRLVLSDYTRKAIETFKQKK